MYKIILFIHLFLIFNFSLKAQNDRFYTSLDGLSGTSMQNFFQDSKGYLWIPTESGLNRFDGYNFKVYLNQPDDSTTINSSSSNVVFEDSSGQIWVGTNYGLNQYDYVLDCFKPIKLSVRNVNFSLTVNVILEDSQKMLWLITSHGLVHFDPKTGKYNFYNHHFRDDGRPAHSKYNQAVFDSRGNLWIGTDDNSVLIFDTQKSQFYTIKEFTGLNYQFPDSRVLVVHKNRSGQLFFGTQRAGLIVYDESSKSFKQAGYFTNPDNLLDGGIYSIITDRRGTVWVGTEHNGLKTYDPRKNEFSDANHLIDIPNVKKAKFLCFEDKL